MVIQNNAIFFENENASKVSKTFVNPLADILDVQVYGDFNAVNVVIEGRLRNSGDWTPLAAINLSNFAVVADGITERGIYEFGVAGVREVRASINNVSGQASVFGQFISTEET